MKRVSSETLSVLFIASAVFSFGAPYAVFKLAAWLLIAFLAGRYLRPVSLLLFFSVAGVLESLLGISQFVAHKSIGFSYFGESILSPLNPSLARTFVSGGRLLRAYGTFPHPNILAAFLVLSLVSLAYFHMRSGVRLRVALTVPIFISCVGFILTFSRTGFLAGILAVSTLIFRSRKSLPREARNTAFVFALCTLLAASSLSWAVVPRLSSIGLRDYAVATRVTGYADSLRRVALHPFFGSGITMRMSDNPVHSAYLVIAEEMGIFGLVVFLCILFAAFMRGFRDIRPEAWVFSAMLYALILIGLTDHFLWTLRPGAAMLWVVIGMLLFEKRRVSHS